MIAIKRLQSIMWILLVAAGALMAYLISLRVATERNEVRHLIDQLRWTRGEIRYLEAEFGARASMRQLSAWNQNDLRLYVPGPTQYLPDERALANLDRIAPAGEGYAPPPVMTAMATQVAPVATSVSAAEPVVVAAQAVVPAPSRASSEFALIRTASAAETIPAPAPRKAAQARPVTDDMFVKVAGAKAAGAKVAGEPDPAARKTARLALLDEKLLGGSGAGRPGAIRPGAGGKPAGSDSKVR